MSTRIINGRRVTGVPDYGVYGHEIIKEMDLGPGRRPILHEDGGFKTIDPNAHYPPDTLKDRYGRP